MQVTGLQTLNALVEELTGNYAQKKDLAQYSLKKQETAEEGYASTYWLTKNGQRAGDAINIPKDKFLKSAHTKTATEDGSPVEGCKAGEKYIDLLVETENSPETGEHLYLMLKDMVEPVQEGDGIVFSEDNAISIKLDTASGNGLSVGPEGLSLALATTSSAGAMSAGDKAKLDGLGFTEITKEEVKAMFVSASGGAQPQE
ncbi:MAG: hypothetical protein K2N87_18625 [Eubacterium sp.]|nr:hypothetical protein [Eubacterium sp.]